MNKYTSIFLEFNKDVCEIMELSACILRRPAATDAFASGRAAVANGHLIKCFPLL